MRDVDPRSVTEVDKEIGARVRARRQELGYSQAYVADVIGITFQQMQKYEAGQNRVASATLLRIAEALNSDPMSLLTGGKHAAAGPRRPRAAQDPLTMQLELAFSRIVSPADRRLVLEMARKLSAQSPRRGVAKKRKTPAKKS